MKAIATACLAATAVATPEKEASVVMTDVCNSILCSFIKLDSAPFDRLYRKNALLLCDFYTYRNLYVA